MPAFVWDLCADSSIVVVVSNVPADQAPAATLPTGGPAPFPRIWWPWLVLLLAVPTLVALYFLRRRQPPRQVDEEGRQLDDDGNVLGKKTPAHAAAVVGDTVGDPCKDTAGPSLHVLVKLLATITLVMAPLFIR